MAPPFVPLPHDPRVVGSFTQFVGISARSVPERTRPAPPFPGDAGRLKSLLRCDLRAYFLPSACETLPTMWAPGFSVVSPAFFHFAGHASAGAFDR